MIDPLKISYTHQGYTEKAFNNFKNKQKSVFKSVFNTLYIKIKYMLKKDPFDKINGTKNALLFLLQAPTHHNFTFNL